ncbi:hypothetical protein B0H14DRAFT_2728344 [Mycena olivaceomarginata]|nr:hypothetical protein B0H14DRAFT_2728344 [Mycena olivaceomarginata]
MDDEEKGNVEERANPEHETAAAKLWAVYISEAEKYDKGLVESWKSDMQGMLIFAGLFSASLTAFLIESYKTLTYDSGDETVRLLAQISHQLSATANGTTLAIPSELPFTAHDQRSYLDASLAGHPCPRVLVPYYGLKRFKMHSVVDVIPLLLHASLLLFFAGLVAFLSPVNIAVMAVTATLLVLIAGVYALLTILPSLYADCPYRTPLSGACWNVIQTLKNTWQCRNIIPDGGSQAEPTVETKAPAGSVIGMMNEYSDEHTAGHCTPYGGLQGNFTMKIKTPVEFMLEKAQEYSEQRIKRDGQALIWTVKSLVDDAELEQLAEAIPDVLWGTDLIWGNFKRRYVYDDHIRRLMEDPNIQVHHRICSLLLGCGSGLLTLEASKCRQILCYKSLWALASLATPGQSRFLAIPRTSDPEVGHYAISAYAVVQWANVHAAQRLLDNILTQLTVYKANMLTNQPPNIQSILSKLQSEYSLYLEPQHYSESHLIETEESVIIQNLIEEIQGLSFIVFINYLVRAGQQSNLIPYHFKTTQELISPPTKVPMSIVLLQRLRYGLDSMVHRHMDLFQASSETHWLEETLRTMLLYWDPGETNAPPALPWGIVQYLNTRSSEGAAREVACSLPQSAWKCIPETIRVPPYRSCGVYDLTPSSQTVLAESLTAVWKLLFFQGSAQLADIMAILEAALSNESPSITPSVIMMAKTALIQRLKWDEIAPGDLVSRSKHPIFPPETSFLGSVPEKMNNEQADYLKKFMTHRCTEAWLHILAEFIECCCSSDIPFKAAETLQQCSRLWPPVSTIHPIHQLRFATALQKLFNASVEYNDRDTLLHQVIGLDIFYIYSPYCVYNIDGGPPVAWLDNTEARNTLKETFAKYQRKWSVMDNPNTFFRMKDIVAQLDALHPGNEKADAMEELHDEEKL